MTTEERLEKLERKYQSLLFVAGSLFTVLLAAVLSGAAPREDVKDEVRARMFTVVDADGKTRAALGLFEGIPGLGLSDENGKTRFRLVTSKGFSGLVMTDENGKPRASLSLSKEGPIFGLSDKNGKQRACLGVLEEGSGIELFDEKGKIVWNAP